MKKTTKTVAKREDWRGVWATMQADLARNVWTLLMREPWAQFYVHYTPSTATAYGVFHIVRDGSDAPAGSVLLTAEQVPAADVQAIGRWLARFTTNLPMLPTNL